MEDYIQLEDLMLEFLQDDIKVLCAGQVLVTRQNFRHWEYSHVFPKLWSALHMCAFFGLHRPLHTLLENGADPDTRDSPGGEPLSWAAEKGHVEVVKRLLLQDGIDVNARDRYDRAPLFWAADFGRAEVVALLLARNDINVNTKDRYGWTPLSCAADGGHVEVVRLLLKRNDIDVNSKNRLGCTPLFWAVNKRHKAIIKLLRERADVEDTSLDIFGHLCVDKSGRDTRSEIVIVHDDISIWRDAAL
jgi:ankyrin repeat protein